jgi:glycosyltransferase involved in cell wall biosynthesis
MADEPLRILGVGDAKSLNFLRWGWRLADRGHEVSIVSSRFSTNAGELDRFDVFDVRRLGASTRVPGLRGSRIPAGIARLAEKLHVDLVHAHYLLPYGWWAAQAGRHPFVASPWGTDILVDAQQEPGGSRARIALDAADAVVVNSEVNAAATRALGVPEELLTKIIWYAEPERFSPGQRDSAVLQELGFPEGSLLVLSLRNFRPDTNLDLVVRAFARVREREPRARLLLAARAGPSRQEVEELIDSLGLGDAVRIRFVSHADLPRVVASADVLVSAAQSDSTPASLLEAMASGLPVVCGIAPSIDEWIEDGEGGALVPLEEEAFAEALLRLLADPELRERYGMRNLHEVHARVGDPSAQLEAVYSEVLGAQRTVSLR